MANNKSYQLPVNSYQLLKIVNCKLEIVFPREKENA